MRKVIIEIKVYPNASSNKIMGWQDHVLKVRIQAPPEKDKANKELLRFLAKSFSLSKSEVILISGAHSRNKKIQLENISLEDIEKLIPKK